MIASLKRGWRDLPASSKPQIGHDDVDEDDGDIVLELLERLAPEPPMRVSPSPAGLLIVSGFGRLSSTRRMLICGGHRRSTVSPYAGRQSCRY